MYSHTLCPVSLPFPALLPQGVPCKGLCQMRVFTVVKGTTSSPHGPHSWTKPCQMMYYSPARTLLSQSHCRYGDRHILWEWNHYTVSISQFFYFQRNPLWIILKETVTIGTFILILLKLGESSHVPENTKIGWECLFLTRFSGYKTVWLAVQLLCGESTEISLVGS